jgi:ABC-type antimicrobial peptide transport system permease subunit
VEGEPALLRVLAGLTVLLAVVGVLAFVLASRFIRAILFEVNPLDPLTLVAVVNAVMAAAMLTCAFPAWRTARVDPAVGLRAE